MILFYSKHSQPPTIILFSWVFHWIKATAAPALLTKHSLERNFVFLTDQDSKAFDAFDAAQSKVYPNSKHRLCAWHKVTNLVSLKGLRVGQDNLAATQMTTVQKWVFSLIFNSESELEYKDCLQKLFHWLGSDATRHRGALGMRNCQLIEAWLNNNFNQPSLLPRLLQYHFKGRRMLDKRTTGGSESLNSTLKGDAAGVRGNYGLKRSADAILRVASKQAKKRRTKHENLSYTTDSICPFGGCTKYSRDLLAEQFTQSVNYSFCLDPVSKSTFFVKRYVFSLL